MNNTNSSGRLVSLDALRGFTMFWIIGGGSLAAALSELSSNSLIQTLANQLEHVKWEGFRFYDLIFPMFVFIVGVSTAFSVPRAIDEKGKKNTIKKIIIRALSLYLIGLVYYGWSPTETDGDQLRYVGVLQRIAICYLTCGLLFCFLNLRGLLVALFLLLIGYWALMSFVPTPGLEKVTFEKGENLANWFDGKYLPGFKWSGTYDPEGLLSTFPAIASCLIGVLVGILFKNENKSPAEKLKWVFSLGVLLIITGSLWSLHFPVIKNLWTSSYVLVAGGCSMIFLGAFYYLIDVKKWKNWSKIFVWIGMNSITIYLAWKFFRFKDISNNIIGEPVQKFIDEISFDHMGNLIISLVSLSLAVLFCRFLYKNKIFLRL
tara:strand:+ start:605 stop:1729 length:1125 start_codon:yes stop_codon:yes gene_type:complete